jgi:hypothetical protein
VQHIAAHRGLELRQRCFDLPTAAVQLRKGGDRVDLWIEQGSGQGGRAGAEPRRAAVVTPLPEDARLWQRRTLGLTNGRPGGKATIGRAPTRRTACTPAWTSRAKGADAHRPRSAPSPSPACQLGCTACT